VSWFSGVQTASGRDAARTGCLNTPASWKPTEAVSPKPCYPASPHSNNALPAICSNPNFKTAHQRFSHDALTPKGTLEFVTNLCAYFFVPRAKAKAIRMLSSLRAMLIPVV